LDPSIARYAERDSEIKNKTNPPLKRIKGTFAQFMYLIEGLISAGILITIGFHNTRMLWKYVVWAVYVFLAIPCLMFVWSESVRIRIDKGISDKKN